MSDSLNGLRIGLGVDAHAFEAGVPLVLGGVAWSLPHGPRRTWIAARPAAAAGTTSLSTRSPT